jgi:hypothetical protein
MFAPRLAFLACLALAVPALAAPVPIEPKGGDDAWVKALPADTDGLFVVDIKAFMASPLVKKGLMGKLPPILGDYFVVPVSLKSLGLDPTKDLKYMILAQAHSMWNGPDGKPVANGDGILFIFQTAKSSAALQTGIDNAVKDGKGVKAVAGAKGKVFEAKAPGKPAFLAVLPGGALAIAPNQRQVEAALAQVRVRPALKNAEVSKFVKGLKPGAVVRGLMLPTCVVGSSSSSIGGVNPMTTVKLMTLADSGMQGVRAEIKVKDALTGFVDIEWKDAAEAAKKGKEARKGLEQIKPILEMQAAAMPELKAVVEVLKKLTIKEVGKVMRIEGEVGPDAVKALEKIPLGGPG